LTQKRQVLQHVRIVVTAAVEREGRAAHWAGFLRVYPSINAGTVKTVVPTAECSYLRVKEGGQANGAILATR